MLLYIWSLIQFELEIYKGATSFQSSPPFHERNPVSSPSPRQDGTDFEHPYIADALVDHDGTDIGQEGS